MTDNQPEEQPNIELLQQDLDAMTNNWKRSLADFENYKRRKEAENKELVEFAREVTVAKLLPTLDTLEQALKHMPSEENQEARSKNQEFFKKFDNWHVGINGILIQLDKTLEELGVKKIEAIGKKFDPHFHEAVREQESEETDGIILSEFQSGFELNGKVIRPSQVVISKKSAKGGE
ncbi:MAG: nucleotide exchange factor GrpE [Candidatus Doudnabacteria bacterium]|jgi:molecular chaperone GrpE